MESVKMLSNILLDYLPIVATVLIIFSYMGQLKVTYGTKNVEGQSLSFWVILTSALAINVVREAYLMYTQGTFGGLLTQGFNFVLAGAILFGVMRYRKK
jgi:uncharacterized protein with PQ loop repeat